MKRIIFFIIYLALAGNTAGQKHQQEYINKYQMLAIEEMGRSGIPASIKMAQACLESAYGQSKLSKSSNNHFGIKCKSNWKGQKVYHDDDHKNECFRKYSSIEESYIDHSNFLMSNTRYAFLFTLPPDDYKGWAKGLKQAGYATAKHYDQSLIKIIENHKLYRLDHNETFSPIAVYEQRQVSNPGISASVTINPYNSHKILKLNGLNAVVAREGDSYEIIAQELGKSTWELYRFNDRDEGYRPQPNEVIYIQPKKNKPAKTHNTHIVGEDETMQYISQLYGIKLKPLLRRNRLSPGQEPQQGDIIYLRQKNPATK